MFRSSRRSRRTLFPPFVRRLDQKVGRRVYNADVTTPLNKTLFALSSAADNGAFWAAIVAGLAMTGRRGRSAAGRGALTLLASTTFANLVAKKAVRAPRPKLRGLPHRKLNRTPTSASFPSGHTATAAALATGVWVSNPKRGIIIAALAVGYSRLHVGAHWFSDVITGNLVGVLIGLLGKVVRPPTRH
jgi:membrane-associated phospholipid phosphatase